MSQQNTGIAAALRPVGYERFPGTSEIPAPVDHAHNIEVEDWKDLELENSWVAYSDTYQQPQFLLDPMGFVHLKMSIKDGTTTPVTLLGTLPVGYRPAENLPVLGGNDSGTFMYAIIATDGTITGIIGLDADHTFLNTIFEADRNTYAQYRN